MCIITIFQARQGSPLTAYLLVGSIQQISLGGLVDLDRVKP